MAGAPLNITQEQVEELVARPKVIYSPFPNWQPKPNNSAFFVRSLVVSEPSAIAIPGLTVELIFRQGRITAGCNDMYNLFFLSEGRKNRVFQLQVIPQTRLGHNPPPIHGPHYHIGNHLVAGLNLGFDCEDAHRRDWFVKFCELANVTVLQAAAPGVQAELGDLWP